jgi:hypothetical protein
MSRKEVFKEAIKEIFQKTNKDLDVLEICSVLGKEYKLYSAHETVRKYMKELVSEGILETENSRVPLMTNHTNFATSYQRTAYFLKKGSLVK